MSASVCISPANPRRKGVDGEEEEEFDRRMVKCVVIVFY